MENTNSGKDRVIMPESASQSKSDWSIGDLYSNAWRIVKKYKVLWIFGMFAMGSIGSNFPSGGGSSSPTPSPSASPFPIDSPTLLNMHNTTSNVLGTSTQSENLFLGLFAHISPGIWVLIGLEFLAMIAIGWTIVIIKNAFANAALLDATESAIDDKSLTLESTAQNVMSKIKPMAWVQVVPGLFLLLGIVASLGIPTLMFAFGGDTLKIVGALLYIPVIIAIVYYSIKITLSSIWATRIVVTEDISGRAAFSRGIRIQKKKKWSMIGLGLVNMITGALIFILPVLVVVGIIFGTIAVVGWTPPESMIPVIIPLAAIFFVAIALLFVLGSGIFNSFKAVVWSLAYRKIKGKYDE